MRDVRGARVDDVSLAFAGRARTVIVHVPPGDAARRRLPLVLDLHGSGSTAAQQERFGGMDAAADAHDFLVAYPQALIPDGRGFDLNVPGVPLVGGRPVPAGSADDVAFLTRLVPALERRYCVDPRRVDVTGFSGGARLASRLACDAASTFAAVAPVRGLRHPEPCPAARPVPVVAFHGTADPIDPYGGHGQSYWTYSVPGATRAWVRQDDWAAAPVTTRPHASVTLVRYERCRGRAVVELYAIAGEGHEWPGGPALPPAYTRLLGPQSAAIDADAAIAAFFAAHPLRRP